MRTIIRIGSWNIRSLNTPGAARLLRDELKAGHIEIMGLHELRWHGAGEMAFENRQLLWSGLSEGQPRQGGVVLMLTNRAAFMAFSERSRPGCKVEAMVWYPITYCGLCAHQLGYPFRQRQLLPDA